MKEEHQEIIKDTIIGASKGAVVAGGGSLLTGAALTTVVTAAPVTVFGFSIPFITTSVAAVVVSTPVVVTAAITGAVVVGAIAAIKRHQKNKKINDAFRDLNGLRGQE